MAQDPVESFAEPDPSPDDDEPQRPDWLVGAEEGVEAEMKRGRSGDGPSFELRRPDVTELPERLAQRREAPPAPAPKPPVRWTGAASSVPRLHEVSAAPAPAPAHRAAPAEEEDARPEDEPDHGFLDAPRGAERTTTAPRPALRPAPVREAFWVVWIDLLASDRRLQVLLGLVVVLVLGMIFWPRGGGGGVAPVARAAR